MVDLTFAARAKHFVPLSLLRFIADVGSAALPEALAYIGDDGMRAIKGALYISAVQRYNI